MRNPEPGDQVTYGGVDYFAAVTSDDRRCSQDCALSHRVQGTFKLCNLTPCGADFVYLTQANFIIHRLTS